MVPELLLGHCNLSSLLLWLLEQLHIHSSLCSEKVEEIKRIRMDLESRGCELPPMKPASSHFDSNCITPGTEFMARLAVCLQFYIHNRMNSNPAWQGIKVR